MKKIFAMLLAAAAIAGCCKNNASDTGETVYNAIMTRKSVRKFDASRTIAPELQEKLLRAAMAAPTAKNLQPWSFIVVDDRATLEKIAEVHPHSKMVHPHSKMTAQAAMAVVVCGNKNNGLEGKGTEYWIQDCSAATENLLLAAHAFGLGAVWCGVHPIDERVDAIREVLQIPVTHQPLNVVAIGYPADDPPVKDKWDPRKIHRNRW